MNQKVGFGIIGAGMIAEFHAKAIQSLENVRLVGFFDTNFASAQKRAEQFHCKAYASFEEFLADTEIEAVTIATPSGFHHKSVLPAAKAHKHILCEKPIEITVEKCKELLQCCEENHVFLVPVFQTRYMPAIQQVRKAFDQGRFGKMLFAGVRMHWFRAESYYAGSSWRGTWAVDGGGALMNQAIHNIDQLLWINGDAASVHAYAATKTHKIEVEDNLAAVVQYKNGSFGTIEVSTSCKPGFARRLEFIGDRGSAVVEENAIIRWEFDQELPEDAEIKAGLVSSGNSAGGSDPTNISFRGHAIQIDNLAKSIRTGVPPCPGALEGLRTVEFICGIYDSVRTGLPHKF